MAHIGEENRLGAGDDLAVDAQRPADLGELERRPDEVVQAGGDEEFFKEAIDEDPRHAGVFHKAGQRRDAVGHKRPDPGKGDSVENDDRRHRHQRQLGSAVHGERAGQFNRRDFVMHPGDGAAENNPEEDPHIDYHKPQQLSLPGTVIFAVNFFRESVGMFQPRVVSAKKHDKTHYRNQRHFGFFIFCQAIADTDAKE